MAAAGLVDKATSGLLGGPDWAVNMEICDAINADPRQIKDVIKAVKKRLQNKDPKVQFFTLMLLEMMIKNGGAYVHLEVAQHDILKEMVKIAKKVTDMQVRDKVLVLLDSWQEAFGGPGGRFPQYYWAYAEVKSFGVVFPQRPSDAPPIFTPPVKIAPSLRLPESSVSSIDLSGTSNLTITAQPVHENISFVEFIKLRNVVDLLNEMLQALSPSDRMGTADEIIKDLANQCCAHQQKIVQMIDSTGDEDVLRHCLELNDILQGVLAKHEAYASGYPVLSEPLRGPFMSGQSIEDEPAEHSPRQRLGESDMQDGNISAQEANNDENSLALVPVDSYMVETPTTIEASGVLVPLDPPQRSSNAEQDLIDLFSNLWSNTAHQETPTHLPPNKDGITTPVGEGSSVPPQTNTPVEGYNAYNSYVAPWAQPKFQQPESPPFPSKYQASSPWAPPSNNPFLSPSYEARASTPSTLYPTLQPVQKFSSSHPQETLLNGQPKQKEATAAGGKLYYMPDSLFSDLIDAKTYGRTATGASDQSMINGSR